MLLNKSKWIVNRLKVVFESTEIMKNWDYSLVGYLFNLLVQEIQ